MKNKNIPVIVVLFIAVAFSVSRFAQHAQVARTDYTKPVYVSRVIDGDTIELSDGERVRYIGIDTPESRVRKGDGWVYDPRPYAEEAIALNRRLVEARPIRLEFDVQKRDRYNRLLAYVYTEEEMVNLEILRQGYAMIYTYPPNVRHVDEFLKAQQEARLNGKGLWAELERGIIPSSEARENIGLIRMVETDVTSTYLSDRVLVLNCRDDFKLTIFKENLVYFPNIALRSPDTYFKHKTIRVFGLIKDYKGASEIILYDPSQLEFVE